MKLAQGVVAVALSAAAAAFAAEPEVPAWVSYESMSATGEREGVSFGAIGFMALGSDILFPVKVCPKASGFHCVRVWLPSVRDIEPFRMAVPRGALRAGMRWRFGDTVFSVVERHEPPPPVSSGGSFPTFEMAFAGLRVSAYLVNVQPASQRSRIRSFLFSQELGVIAINVDCKGGAPLVCRQLLLAEQVGLFSPPFDDSVSAKSAPESNLPVLLK